MVSGPISRPFFSRRSIIRGLWLAVLVALFWLSLAAGVCLLVMGGQLWILFRELLRVR